MQRTLVGKWFIILMAMGLGIPGCFLFGDDENEGRICASPTEGGVYCVPSSSGPGAAWAKAEANGTEPIQMWAEWPENMELDEVVVSPGALETWLSDVQSVKDYLRVTRGNADSYHASLSGKMGEWMKRAFHAQNDILSWKLVSSEFLVGQAMLDKVKAKNGPVATQMAADKQTMGDVAVVFDTAKLDAGPFAASYATLVDEFVAYRATEAAETTTYTTLAKDASNAMLAALDTIELSIVDAAHSTSAKPNALIVSAIKLSAQILQFEKTSREAISRHTDFMSTHGAAIPDMSSGALRSIHAMLGYMQQRVARSDATAKGLLLGVGMRRQALQLLANAPATARMTIAKTLLAGASTRFETAARVRVDAVAASTATSANLGLPYLANRYDEFAVIMQMVPLCETASSSWRESGCVSMRPKFNDATKYLKVTLPLQIAQGLTAMKNHGIDPVVIDRVQKKLTTGDIKGAALAHDALLRSTEGT